MNIRCGICHAALVVDVDIQDGQDLQCPYCNGIFTYQKPTRIEVPAEARNSCGGETPTPQTEDIPDIPKISQYKRNPKLHIIRPTNNASNRSPEANSMVASVDARAKAEFWRTRMLKFKKQASNLFAILVLAGLGYAGFKGYQIWKNGDEDKVLSDVSERIKDGIGFVQQKLGHEAGNQGEDQPCPAKVVSPVDETQKNKGELEVDELTVVKSKFVGSRLSYWGKLPKDERPGAIAGTFYLAVAGKKDCEYYEIESSTGNKLQMRSVGKKDASVKQGYDAYSQMLTDRGGLVWKDGTAYLITVSKKNKGFMAPLNADEIFDPAEMFMGKLYSVAKEMETSDVRFEVLFSFDEGYRPQKVATVRFGETLPYGAFEKAAARILKEIKKKSSAASPTELKRVLAAGNVIVKRI